MMVKPFYQTDVLWIHMMTYNKNPHFDASHGNVRISEKRDPKDAQPLP
jgi:hypothetical protein